MNEKKLRLFVFFIAAILHLVIIFFFVFDTEKIVQKETEIARVMKLTDLSEIPPVSHVPPAPPKPEVPQVEDIAEVMIETDIPPVQNIETAPAVISQDVYLPMHLVSILPEFDEKSIISDIIYPPIALRSGIAGRVILELLVDHTGTVQKVIVVREEPQGRGFGDAAIKVFLGRKGKPAAANGEPVSCRFRYPITFTPR